MFHQLYPRNWTSSPATSKPQDESDQLFTVMQFNILADSLSGKDEKKGGFTKTPPECLDWEKRKDGLMEEILRFGPDVVCLEECDHYSDWFEPVMKQRGYVSWFKPKADRDGSVVAFKSDKFELAKSSQQPTLLTYKDASQGAILAHLVHLSSGKEILVVVTHLKSTKSVDGEQIRLAQSEQLLECIRTTLGGRNDIGVILCCDLNAEPMDSSNCPALAYPLFLNDAVLGLDSAYRAVLGSEPLHTTWKLRHKEAKMTIDYIFFSKNVLTVVDVLGIPSEEEVDEIRLPSWRYPSDHFAIAASFKFI